MGQTIEKIFISHASKDKTIVDIFVDKILVCGMGFSNNDIFCTSLEGLGIKTGEDWRNEIHKHLCNAKVVILLITPNYKESEMCLNEMGAAWAIDTKVIPIVVPPINFDSIGVIYKVKQALEITSSSDIDELKDSLEEFNTNKNKTSRWNTKKIEAISAIEKYIKENPFEKPLSRDEFCKLQKELNESNDAIKELIEEKEKYYKLYNEIKVLKNKNDVTKLEKESGLLDEYDDFIKKAKELGNLINSFSAPIQSIIYFNLTDQGIKLSGDNIRLYSQELKEAFASKIIDEDEILNIEHPRIKIISDFWSNFTNEFEHLKPETFEKLENEYSDIVLDIDSSDFWTDVMGVNHIIF
ncbi:TIR domain-containing protein [bacterium]|nr:TIR domain-containing protein [bacterium]